MSRGIYGLLQGSFSVSACPVLMAVCAFRTPKVTTARVLPILLANSAKVSSYYMRPFFPKD